jgi:hypothetical protein
MATNLRSAQRMRTCEWLFLAIVKDMTQTNWFASCLYCWWHCLLPHGRGDLATDAQVVGTCQCMLATL